jgi:hypothetical protein
VDKILFSARKMSKLTAKARALDNKVLTPLIFPPQLSTIARDSLSNNPAQFSKHTKPRTA